MFFCQFSWISFIIINMNNDNIVIINNNVYTVTNSLYLCQTTQSMQNTPALWLWGKRVGPVKIIDTSQ